MNHGKFNKVDVLNDCMGKIWWFYQNDKKGIPYSVRVFFSRMQKKIEKFKIRLFWLYLFAVWTVFIQKTVKRKHSENVDFPFFLSSLRLYIYFFYYKKYQYLYVLWKKVFSSSRVFSWKQKNVVSYFQSQTSVSSSRHDCFQKTA